MVVRVSIVSFKEAGLPIDSVVQMALQLAWGRMHGAPVACYETSHLRIFKGARTETCRSTSVESKAWVDAVLAGQPAAAQKQLFRQACEAQKNYMMGERAAWCGGTCD